MNTHYSSEKGIQILVKLLKEHHIKRVITSPGGTNMMLNASLMYDGSFEMYSSVDERSAAYMACGMAEESGEPVMITCTGATGLSLKPWGIALKFLFLHHENILFPND